MGNGTYAIRLSSSPRIQSVKVNMTIEEIEKNLEALPVAHDIRKRVFTEEEDELLLKYWNSGRRKDDIAKAFGICQSILRRRYRELTEGKNEN